VNKPSQLGELRKELAEIRALVASTRREMFSEREKDKEVLDPTPAAIPISVSSPPSMQELVQRYVRETVSEIARDEGHGTFEEEDDFEEDDHDELSLSGFEVTEYQMEDDPGIEDGEGEKPADSPPEAPGEDPPPGPEGPDLSEGDAPTAP